MELKEIIFTLFEKTCKEKNNYTTEELSFVIDKAIQNHNIEDKQKLFAVIEEVAKERTSGLNVEQIKLAKSADQKWLNISGLAYERIIKNEINNEFQDEIIALTSSEVGQMLKENLILNSENDKNLLATWVKGKTFDLFIGKNISNRTIKIFGVVQCKKSIRERVSRDREPSLFAMENGFWSILIASDGGALGSKTTKAREMFNGNGVHFEKNGWDSAYFENLSFESGRIFFKERLFKDIKNNSSFYK